MPEAGQLLIYRNSDTGFGATSVQNHLCFLQRAINPVCSQMYHALTFGNLSSEIQQVARIKAAEIKLGLLDF